MCQILPEASVDCRTRGRRGNNHQIPRAKVRSSAGVKICHPSIALLSSLHSSSTSKSFSHPLTPTDGQGRWSTNCRRGSEGNGSHSCGSLGDFGPRHHEVLRPRRRRRGPDPSPPPTPLLGAPNVTGHITTVMQGRCQSCVLSPPRAQAAFPPPPRGASIVATSHHGLPASVRTKSARQTLLGRRSALEPNALLLL